MKPLLGPEDISLRHSCLSFKAQKRPENMIALPEAPAEPKRGCLLGLVALGSHRDFLTGLRLPVAGLLTLPRPPPLAQPWLGVALLVLCSRCSMSGRGPSLQGPKALPEPCQGQKWVKHRSLDYRGQSVNQTSAWISQEHKKAKSLPSKLEKALYELF